MISYYSVKLSTSINLSTLQLPSKGNCKESIKKIRKSSFNIFNLKKKPPKNLSVFTFDKIKTDKTLK